MAVAPSWSPENIPSKIPMDTAPPLGSPFDQQPHGFNISLGDSHLDGQVDKADLVAASVKTSTCLASEPVGQTGTRMEI